MKHLDTTIIQLLESTARNIKAQPINLGGLAGPGGGIGSPPGGYIGWLPQTRVAYDDDEIASSGITGSGATSSGTLLDNLNHIRYRLGTLESGILVVDELDGSPIVNNVNHISFSGGVIVTEVSSGHALVTITASGGGSALTVEQSGGTPINNVDRIIFSGAIVTDLGSGDVRVTISGGGTFIVHEDFSPTSSGITHYNTLYTMHSGTLEVYYNGIRQEPIQHYLEDFSGGGFTLQFSPENSGVLIADYLTTSSGFSAPSGGTTVIYSGISSSFLGLSDTPDTYSGQANKVVVVNGTENGLIFSTPSTTTIGARVYRNIAQSINNNTNTNISFTHERYDTDNIWVIGSPTRLTCQTSGKYLVGGHISFAANATGIRIVEILHGGGWTIAQQSNQASTDGVDYHSFSISTVYDFTAGEYVTLSVRQKSGGSLNVQGSSDYQAEFFMHKIG